MGKRFLTDEQKKHFKEAREKTMLQKYGVKSLTNSKKVKSTKLEKYGDENYNNQSKREQTCLIKYGETHPNKTKEISNKISKKKKTKEVQEKYEHTMEQKYGNKNPNLVSEIREKYLNTLNENYGVSNPLKNKQIKEKQLQTLKENGNINKSKPEDDYYTQLVEEFGEEDVIRNYKDERYPFNCDFYIKSLDLFIELNLHPSHGNHPFNPEDENDILLLEELKKENSRWSNMIIDVWSIRDYTKRKYAIKNKLNYKTIYSK